jgi:hypothetical protein
MNTSSAFSVKRRRRGSAAEEADADASVCDY